MAQGRERRGSTCGLMQIKKCRAHSAQAPPGLRSPSFEGMERKHFLAQMVTAQTGAAEIFGFKAEKKGAWVVVRALCGGNSFYALKTSF